MQFYVISNGDQPPDVSTSCNFLRVEDWNFSFIQQFAKKEDDELTDEFCVNFYRNECRDYYSRPIPRKQYQNFRRAFCWMTVAGCPFIPLEDISEFCASHETFETVDLEKFAIKVFEKYTTVKTVEGENDESDIG